MRLSDKYDYITISDRLYEMQKAHDLHEGRKFNRSAFGNIPRLISRPLTKMFVRFGIRARYVTLAHWVFEMGIPTFIFFDNMLLALVSWFIAFILDHSDGDVARAMNDQNDLWDDVDQAGHVWLLSSFWLAVGIVNDRLLETTIILGLHLLAMRFRLRLKKSETYSEKSRLWRWLSRPMNMNYLIIGYFIVQPLNPVWIFHFYIAYLLAITVGQHIKLIKDAWV